MSSVRTVRVTVENGYDVRIGAGVLREAPAHLPGRKIAVISDHAVATLHAGPVVDAFEADGRDVYLFPVPVGERSKDLATFGDLARRLARAGFGRDDGVMALGGGVVGDLAGFVAASYLRGVGLLQAPTSLLAMADAAIGGKTGLNLPEGKNLLGAFWRPRAVLMDVRTLATLPPAQVTEGLAEVLKHGLLNDPELTTAVTEGQLAADADPDQLIRWVAASAAVKADVVARDEHEGGVRAHLNLGHTVAHALEAASAHRLSHGSAVAWGLAYAAILSRRHARNEGRDPVDWSEPVWALLRSRRVPRPDRWAWSELLPFLERDKKVRAGRRRWVLMDAPGRPRVVDDVPPDMERAAWDELRDRMERATDREGATA
ncbi:MAG: 3-dehydroquinate synthase [Trueperaceae bacterium]